MPITLHLIVRIVADDIPEGREKLKEDPNWIRFTVWIDGLHHVASETIVGGIIQYRPGSLPVEAIEDVGTISSSSTGMTRGGVISFVSPTGRLGVMK